MTSDLDRALVEALAQLVDAAVRHNLRVAQARGTAAIDLRAVSLLDRAGELRSGQLAQALGSSSSGTSTIIRRLVAAGLVQRYTGPNTNDVYIRSVNGAAADLGLAPNERVVAVCDQLGLDHRERETIVAFAAQAAELIDRQTDAIRLSAFRESAVPSPPRWS